jgi:hypothetical protein
VPAIQDVERENTRARFAFDVVLERSEKRLIAKLENMRVIPLPGAHRPALEHVVASFEGRIPPIAVADTGESQGAIDLEKAIDSILALVATTKNNPQVDAVSKLLRSPRWKAAFAQKAGETWDAWAGTWTGLELAPNTVLRATYDLPSAVGTFKDVPLVITHHGSVRDAPALVLLSVEQVLEGPKLVAIIGSFLDDLAPGVGSGAITSVRKTDRSMVAIDPVLGRPHRARQETVIEVDDRSRKTTRDTAFDWAHAAGCVTSRTPH